MIITSLPSLFFWALLIFGRHELGARWVVGLLLAYVGSFVFLTLAAPAMASGLFLAAQALLVIIMTFKVFGLDYPRS